MNPDARETGRINPGRLLGVIALAALCGAAAFAWTIQTSPLKGTARHAELRRGFSADPQPGWGGRARTLLARGDAAMLLAESQNRIHNWGNDPEAWLFAGFACAVMADRPGLASINARQRAREFWLGLLIRCEPWRAYTDPDGIVDWEAFADSGEPPRGAFASDYYAGWALLGLGRVTEARDRFARFYGRVRDRLVIRGDFYNLACYATLAGDTGTARTAWIRACAENIIDPVWGAADPDLEALHGDPVFGWMLEFARSRGSRGNPGRVILPDT